MRTHVYATVARNSRSAIQPFLMADTEAIADRFISWRDALPDIGMFVDDVIFDIQLPTPRKRIIQAAAKLASEPNDNKFHHNQHFLQVFAMSYTLGYHALKQGRMDGRKLDNLFAAALIHDRGHDGGVNGTKYRLDEHLRNAFNSGYQALKTSREKKDSIGNTFASVMKGINQSSGSIINQFRLENIAFQESKSSLSKAGASPKDLAIIEALVLATDVTKDFSDPHAISPAESLEQYVQTGKRELVHPKLRILVDEDYVDVGLMLQDADVAPSYLNVESAGYSSDCLAEERGKEPVPEDTWFFLKQICHGQCSSISGKAVLQPCLDKVMGVYDKAVTGMPSKSEFKIP